MRCHRLGWGYVPVLLVLAVGSTGPGADAGEAGWQPLVLEQGEQRVAMDVPAGWVLDAGPGRGWVGAHDPDDPATRARLTRHPLAPDEDRAAFARRHLQEEQGATIRDAGFRIEDRAGEMTLVARSGATPPLRSLYVHRVAGEHGFALRIDLPLGSFHERRDLVLAIAESLQVVEAPSVKPVEPRPQTPSGQRFAYEIPEDVFFQGHDFLRIVERANEKGTFGDHEGAAYAMAVKARARAEHHVARLRRDRAYRAADQMFANAALNPKLEGKHLLFRWVEPYALVWVSDDPLDPYPAALHADATERATALERIRKRRAHAEAALDEKALVLTQVYRFLLDRFGDSHELRDLMGPYGGRPDYRDAYRSYPEGAPLLVLVFGSLECRLSYLEAIDGSRSRDRLPHFDPRTAALALVASYANWNGTMGAQHLLHWFTRQRNQWRDPRIAQSAVALGLSAWIGGTKPHPSGKLEHTGVNLLFLRRMVEFARQFEKNGRSYPVFPLKQLLAFESYREAIQRGVASWGLRTDLAYALLHQQTWALALFLDEFQDGKYRQKRDQLLEALLSRELGNGNSLNVAKRVLSIRDDEDWQEIESNWQRFVAEDLLKREPAEIGGEPQGGDERRQAFLKLSLPRDGSASVAWSYSAYGRGWNDAGEVPAEHLPVLLDRLADLPGIRQAEGESHIRVVVEAAPDVGWATVQTYVDACAASGAAVAELTCGGITSALDLLGRGEVPDAALLVDVQRWDDEGKTVVQLDDYRFDLARTDMTEAERGGLVVAMGEVIAHVREEEKHAVIRFRPAKGPLPPVRDVHLVIDALHTAGVKHITLEAPHLTSEAVRLRMERPDVRIVLDEDGAAEIYEGVDAAGGWQRLVDPGTQTHASTEAAIRDTLQKAAKRCPREKDGASTARVLVEGRPGVSWAEVQKVMQIAGEQDIRIYRIQYRVRRRPAR